MAVNNDELIFSVVIITYNQEKYIGKTLDSILSQEHSYSYEIIIGDDCSSDKTPQIIEEYRKSYPSIVKPIYNSKNLGAMNNYYNTISKVKGKYIMICGGDDYWLPLKVETQISFMEKNEAFGLCYGISRLCDENDNTLEDTTGVACHNPIDILKIGNSVPASTVCVRRTLFEKYITDIAPQNKNWLMEDYPLNIYAFLNSYVHFFDKCLSMYRIVNGSITHQKNLKKLYTFEKSVYEIRSFFSDLYEISIELFNPCEVIDLLEKNNSNINGIKAMARDLKRELKINTNRIKCLNLSKKFIKNFLPYGVLKLMKKCI